MSKARKKTEAHAFLTKSRCPRCGNLNTEAYSTKGKTQYRRCRGSMCRKRYTVAASPV